MAAQDGGEVMPMGPENLGHRGFGDFVGGEVEALGEHGFLAHRDDRNMAGGDRRAIGMSLEVSDQLAVALDDRCWEELRDCGAGIVDDDEPEASVRESGVKALAENFTVSGGLLGRPLGGAVFVVADDGVVGNADAVDQSAKRREFPFALDVHPIADVENGIDFRGNTAAAEGIEEPMGAVVSLPEVQLRQLQSKCLVVDVVDLEKSEHRFPDAAIR